MTRAPQIALGGMILAVATYARAEPLFLPASPSAGPPAPIAKAQPRATIDAAEHTMGSVPRPVAARDGVWVEGGRVSVAVRRASLSALLTRLADESGFSLQIAPDAGDRQIDARFSDRDTMSALRLLLEDADYVITLANRGARQVPATVHILRLGATPDGSDASADVLPDPHALLQELDSAAMPPGVHADLQGLMGPPDTAVTADIHARRGEVIDRVLDRLAGEEETPTLRQLRRTLSRPPPDAGCSDCKENN